MKKSLTVILMMASLSIVNGQIRTAKDLAAEEKALANAEKAQKDSISSIIDRECWDMLEIYQSRLKYNHREVFIPSLPFPEYYEMYEGQKLYHKGNYYTIDRVGSLYGESYYEKRLPRWSRPYYEGGELTTTDISGMAIMVGGNYKLLNGNSIEGETIEYSLEEKTRYSIIANKENPNADRRTTHYLESMEIDSDSLLSTGRRISDATKSFLSTNKKKKFYWDAKREVPVFHLKDTSGKIICLVKDSLRDAMFVAGYEYWNKYLVGYDFAPIEEMEYSNYKLILETGKLTVVDFIYSELKKKNPLSLRSIDLEVRAKTVGGTKKMVYITDFASKYRRVDYITSYYKQYEDEQEKIKEARTEERRKLEEEHNKEMMAKVPKVRSWEKLRSYFAKPYDSLYLTIQRYPDVKFFNKYKGQDVLNVEDGKTYKITSIEFLQFFPYNQYFHYNEQIFNKSNYKTRFFSETINDEFASVPIFIITDNEDKTQRVTLDQITEKFILSGCIKKAEKLFLNKVLVDYYSNGSSEWTCVGMGYTKKVKYKTQYSDPKDELYYYELSLQDDSGRWNHSDNILDVSEAFNNGVGTATKPFFTAEMNRRKVSANKATAEAKAKADALHQKRVAKYGAEMTKNMESGKIVIGMPKAAVMEMFTSYIGGFTISPELISNNAGEEKYDCEAPFIGKYYVYIRNGKVTKFVKR